MSDKYDVVFVLGGPGAGKGTQCVKIVEKYGFVHLSAGDLLRAERSKPDSEYGELIETHIVNGTIVPVAITCSLLERAMKESGSHRFLIDGFPRNQDNVDGWNESMSGKVNFRFVLFFDCDQETCVKRCLARGAAGSGRKDDNEESLKKRFETYSRSTMGVIDTYEALNLVRRIDAREDADKVFGKVREVFDKEFK